MLTELTTTPILLYRWGRWVWYYRALALVTYTTVVLAFIAFSAIIRDLINEPTPANLLLVALVVLLLVVCGLWAVTTWHQGSVRAERIVLSGDRQALTIKTLNFTSRTVRVTDVKHVEYSTTQHYATPGYYNNGQVYEPTLMVNLHQGRPIRVDMQGHILDIALFKAIFPHDPKRGRGAARKKGKGRDVPTKR